jgi:hypothetical protein
MHDNINSIRLHIYLQTRITANKVCKTCDIMSNDLKRAIDDRLNVVIIIDHTKTTIMAILQSAY